MRNKRRKGIGRKGNRKRIERVFNVKEEGWGRRRGGGKN